MTQIVEPSIGKACRAEAILELMGHGAADQGVPDAVREDEVAPRTVPGGTGPKPHLSLTEPLRGQDGNQRCGNGTTRTEWRFFGPHIKVRPARWAVLPATRSEPPSRSTRSHVNASSSPSRIPVHSAVATTGPAM